MRSPSLRGTRYFAKKRAVIILLLIALTALTFLLISFGLTGLTSSTHPLANSLMMTEPQFSSWDTVSLSRDSDLLKLDEDVLLRLVNMTDAHFVESSSNVPYYIVFPPGAREEPGNVLGLVYVTTDIALEWTWGYNSYITVVVFIDTTGTIKSLIAWADTDSWGYKITDDWVNKQFVNRNVFEPLQAARGYGDIDAVTGATATSRGIASGVREAGRIVVADYWANLSTTAVSTTSNSTITESSSNSTVITSTIGTSERTARSTPTPSIHQQDLTNALIMTGMFGASLLAYRRNDERFKYALLAGAVLFLGIYTGRMVSIVDLIQFTSFTLPPLFSNLYWYVLYGGMLVTSFIWGRTYCGHLCPFGAFTQIINRISPFKRRVPIKIHSRLVYLKYIILAGVVIGLLFGNIWVVRVEPFETFFFLTGEWWMWATTIAAVILSVPFQRFYCSYFCPAGAAMALVARLRVEEIRRWPECNICKVCERNCPSGAIVGPKISALECMNCRECERNYLNAKICPHYAHERAKS
jgi:Pyruvate/2-oxoacid:ferredoxin oxidoreductase delta subunit